jgi:hypothetical protein
MSDVTASSSCKRTRAYSPLDLSGDPAAAMMMVLIAALGEARRITWLAVHLAHRVIPVCSSSHVSGLMAGDSRAADRIRVRSSARADSRHAGVALPTGSVPVTRRDGVGTDLQRDLGAPSCGRSWGAPGCGICRGSQRHRPARGLNLRASRARSRTDSPSRSRAPRTRPRNIRSTRNRSCRGASSFIDAD